MTPTWMLYGANGFTGRLILQTALLRGHRPVVAGRHPQKVLELAQSHGLEARVFDLEHAQETRRALSGMRAVLLAAGPFSKTSAPVLDACLSERCHYFDITGEIQVMEDIYRRDSTIAQAGVIAIPGVGFDVVPSDCVAARLKALVPEAHTLRIVLDPHGGRLSPGTLKTLVEAVRDGGRSRIDGQLVAEAIGAHHLVIPRTGGGYRRAFSVPWGDLASAYRTTGIPNIQTYLVDPVPTGIVGRLARGLGPFRPLLKLPGSVPLAQEVIKRTIKGPSAAVRERGTVTIYGEIEGGGGAQKVALAMTTCDGYSYTADAAVRAVEEVFARGTKPGAYTPTAAFGTDFALQVAGTTLTEIKARIESQNKSRYPSASQPLAEEETHVQT